MPIPILPTGPLAVLIDKVGVMPVEVAIDHTLRRLLGIVVVARVPLAMIPDWIVKVSVTALPNVVLPFAWREPTMSKVATGVNVPIPILPTAPFEVSIVRVGVAMVLEVAIDHALRKLFVIVVVALFPIATVPAFTVRLSPTASPAVTLPSTVKAP